MNIKPAILREALIERTVPVLLYDYEAIEANFKFFRQASSAAGATWSFAVKSLARPEVFEVGKSYVDGFDISNLNEWFKIKPFIEKHHKVWLTNANLARELETFISEVNSDQLLVCANDLTDFNLLARENVSYVIRLSTSDLVDQVKPTRFGIRIEELESIKEQLLGDKNFKGFHFHQGIEDNSFLTLKKILESVREKLSAFSKKDYLLNIGGGLQDLIHTELETLLNFLKGDFRMHLEPGRALFKNAGHALAGVEKFFVSNNCLRIFTRLSFSNHLKWTAPVFAGILNLDEKLETFHVNNLVVEGPTCYELDRSFTVAVDHPISLAKGSLIVFDNINGYASEWNTEFNGVPACEVKFIGRRRADNP